MAALPESCFLSLLLLLLVIGISEAGEFCYNNGVYLEYCEYGCCSGSCCFLSAWLIGVIVVGSIIFICVVIAIICCVVKSKGSQGRVVQPVNFQPHGNVNVAMVSHTGQSGWGQPPYGQVPHPPPYGQVPHPPPYGQHPPPPVYSDPAYPPPSQPPGQPSQPDQSPFAKAANSAT
ncbi:uncharacterized protein [Littorina saxatilis]|uniref:Uncharacterized protein n=1 Tax=Littorina saxatilis TaxID=31220 RepID=A0AAN9BB75_9CAEN